MRKLVWILLVGGFGCVPGCSEFVGPVVRTTDTTIDVVGDPSDPVSNSSKQADVLGAGIPSLENAESNSDLIPSSTEPAQISDEAEVSVFGTDNSDVVGSTEAEKPDQLKTTSRDSNKPE